MVSSEISRLWQTNRSEIFLIQKYSRKRIIRDFKMVKFIVKDDRREIVKFTREVNTYGFDGNGIGDELLFPIRLNSTSRGNLTTNLATYLVKYMEFEKTSITIKKVNDKEWV